MYKFMQKIGLGLLAFQSLSNSMVLAEDFPEGLIFLGDSLTDLGNFPGAPITDGYTWPYYLGQDFDITVLPSSLGGTDYAYAGALASFNQAGRPSILTQSLMIPGNVSRHYPVFILGGANDILGSILQPALSRLAVAALSQTLDNLHNQDFDFLIIATLPDLGRVPRTMNLGPIVSGLATQYTLGFNAGLEAAVASKNYSVLLADGYSLFNDIISHPEEYGFFNVTSAAPVGIEPTGYLFTSDGLHPTEAAHVIIADYFYGLVTAPEQYAILARHPFTLLRQQNQAIYQQLYPVQPCHELCTFYPFLSVSGSPHSSISHEGRRYKRDHNWGTDVIFGATNRINECLTVGAAFGVAYQNSKVEHRHLVHNSYKTNTVGEFISLFGSYATQDYYINGIIDAGLLQFYDLHRKFVTGPAVHTANGDTNGRIWGFAFQGGYNLYNCSDCFETGPIATLEFQRIAVDRYKEHGSRIGNVVFEKQHNYNVITGLGWEVIWRQEFCSSLVTTDFYVTANEQWHESNRRVRFREVTMEGNHGTWPVKEPQNFFVTGNLTLSAELPCNQVVTLGYQANIGQNHFQEHMIAAGFTFPW